MKKASTVKFPLQLGIIKPNSAGIDVGSMNMMVAYPGADGIQQVQEFDAYTDDLHALADHLQQVGVHHVAMEATGSYWLSVYDVLTTRGFEVTVANPTHYKNVDAQKTDVNDSQWLQQLHAHGLLRSSHIAEEQYRELRAYIHQRNIKQSQKSDTLNRIQKVLTEMNIKVQHIISDIEGVTGMMIIERISAGITDPVALLAGVKINQLKASKQDLERSLVGLYKPYQITLLKNYLSDYHYYKSKMLEFEKEITDLLTRLVPPHAGPVTKKEKATKVRKNQYHYNIKEYLHKIVGVDLTEIDGLEENTVLTVISVTGLNMKKWPTAGHFTSWLNLAARPKISGGKVIGYHKRITNNTATQAFRMAAQTMFKNKGQLGQLYRRLSATKGSKKAIKAVARRLAVIFYNMVSKQTKYDPKMVVLDEEKIRERKLARLNREATKLGAKVVFANN